MNDEELEFRLRFAEEEAQERERIAFAIGEEKGRADAIEDFANWLVKYKVIPDGAMAELIRDFNGERKKN